VGEEGVEGGIEKFREADNGNGAWRNYWIPCSTEKNYPEP
jgi:hypothetical protein